MKKNTLSPREREVLELISQGLVAKEVAARLHISDQTVKNHLQAVRKKLGTSTTTHAVATAHKEKTQKKVKGIFEEIEKHRSLVDGDCPITMCSWYQNLKQESLNEEDKRKIGCKT